MRAYYHDEKPGDQRLPHDSGEELSVADLKALGVLAYHFDSQDDVDKLAVEREYKNRDVVVVSPEAMGDAYESKLKIFYAEHLHEDEEIRYILDGDGFFDVRATSERWVRVALAKGDLLILPAGIYHRYTPGQTGFTKTMRLFKDEPKWVAHGRSSETDEFESRKTYLTEISA